MDEEKAKSLNMEDSSGGGDEWNELSRLDDNCKTDNDVSTIKIVPVKRTEKYIGVVGKQRLRSTFLLTLLVTTLVSLSVFLGWFAIPCLIKSVISNKIALSPDITPELYSAWIHPPIPVYLKIYLYNVTNSDDVKKGALPQFQELGPYVFLENRTKVDISQDDHTDTILYSEYTGFYFQEKMSGNANLDDVVTILNVPFVAATIKVDGLPWPINGLAKTIIAKNKEPIFIQKTVKETLFAGWKVPFLEKIEEEVGISMLPNNTFGYFVDQNTVVQGPFNISRGILNKSSLGAIVSYKNQTNLDFWGEPTNFCNRIEGTDGTIFPPFLDKSKTLHLFRPEVCVTTYVDFVEEVNYNGIKGYRYAAPPSMTTSPRESEQNQCYCSTINEEPEKCYGTGVLDLSECKDGAPVAMSGAHFFGADQIYIDEGGLVPPERERDETYIDIEPTTGVVLRASKKLQINLKLKRVSTLRKLPEMLFPLFWAEECASLDDDLTTMMKLILFVIWLVEFISKWALPTVALVISIVLISKHLNVQDETKYTY